MKSVCIGHNTGLGDHIIMSGAVRYISRSYDNTFILCLPQRFDHVNFLYRDSENIIPKIMPNARRCSERHKSADVVFRELEKTYNIEKMYSFQYNKRRWAKWHQKGKSFINMQYDAIGVDRQERLDSFYLERDHEAEDMLLDELRPERDYAFVCANWSCGGIDVDDLNIGLPKIVASKKTNLIFDWLKIIEMSKEIYSVDTSFFHLINSIKINSLKFYLNHRRSIATGEDYLLDWKDYD